MDKFNPTIIHVDAVAIPALGLLRLSPSYKMMTEATPALELLELSLSYEMMEGLLLFKF